MLSYFVEVGPVTKADQTAGVFTEVHEVDHAAGVEDAWVSGVGRGLDVVSVVDGALLVVLATYEID